MKKIFSFVAAALVAVAVSAQTDFSTPYYCAADDAVLTGGSSSNFFLKSDVTPHCVAWSDVSLSSNAKATWTINATRGCYVSVSLDLGLVIASNKHNFEIRIYDSNNNLKGMVTEGGENTASMQVKEIDGTILIPLAGAYTVEVYNNRDWGKGTVNNVILTYAADAPSEIIEVTSVELNKTAVTLDLEEVELLTATVTPDNATDPSVTWVSSNPEVATVNENGFITAVAAGTANITATAGEQSAVCEVTVAAADVPSTDFAGGYYFRGKNAHLEGAIWKNEDYKLYGDGGHNKNYGTASWTINVTKACIVEGMLMGVEGGHTFGLDVYDSEDNLIGSLEQAEGSTWWTGNISLDGGEQKTITFPAAGVYTVKLRNTQEWSSGKVQNICLTYVADAPITLYLKLSEGDGNWASWPAKYAIYYFIDEETNGWSEFMTAVPETTNIYVGTIPAEYADEHIIFVRLDGEATAPNWDDRWSQTVNLEIPDGKDFFIVTSGGTGNECDGVWAKYGEEYVPQHADGYYLVGTFGGQGTWSANDVMMMTLNTEAGHEEYMITVTLAEGDELKVIKSESDIYTWYPDGNPNYVVDAEHAGEKTIYFRPDGLGDEAFYHGYIYIAPNEPTALHNTSTEVKVQKMIENGQMVIMKNGVKYNVLGAFVK